MDAFSKRLKDAAPDAEAPMKKAKAFSLFVLTLGLLFSLSGAPAAGQGFPRTIDAGGGRTIIIQRPPQRIVSLTIPVDEILYALVDKSRVQAVTYLAVEPSISNIIPWAKDIPYKIQADIEEVLACDPDIVFIAKGTRAEIVKLLLATGLPIVQINSQNNIKDVKENIRKMAEALGVEEKAEKTIAEMDRKLREVAAKIKTVKSLPRVMTYNINGFTSGKDRTAHELIVLGGGVNVAAEKGIVGGMMISEEKLIEWNPEVLLLSGYAPGKETFPNELRANPALQTVDAIKNNRVYVIHGKYFTTSSQFIVDGVEAIARVLHPELYLQEVKKIR